MAIFPGLRLTLLVLTGLALYGETIETNSSGPANTVSSSTASPTPTSSKSIPESKDTRASSSDPASITSPSTTSPTATTDTSPICSYKIESIEDYAFQVNIVTHNANGKQFNVHYTDTSDNTTKTKSIDLNNSVQIDFKDLKPCRNYTVSVNACKVNGTNIFNASKLVEADITNMTLERNTLCFITKWNLSECINVTKDTACTDHKIFKNTCNEREMNISLPPVEQPDIKFTKWIPTLFTWANKPKNCREINITCTPRGSSHSFPVKSGKTHELIPFTEYNCTGNFQYKPFKDLEINRSSIPHQVNITCDLRNPAVFKPKIDSISASWNKTQSCPKELNATVDCSNQSPPKPGNCTVQPGNHTCEVTPLNPFTDYNCMFTVYLNGSIINSSENVQTQPGQPQINKISQTFSAHNAINVSYEVVWLGKEKKCRAELFNHHKHLEHQSRDSKCYFFFNDLNYLTTYVLTVYAENEDFKSSDNITFTTQYNDKAVLGFLGFLIFVTSIALLFVLYKIYLLKRKQSRDEREMDDLLPANTLLPVDPIVADALVETYKKKIADDGRLFMEEFQSIPRIFSNYTVKEAKKAENQSKNRYVDILPYDYNRVPLSNGGRHDYINASFIEGYKESNKYIAAQGPKEETVGDFWRMIWEQQTSIIVMVTRCEEGNKNKCAQYWPSVERETEIFDDFVVKIKGEENFPDYIIRRLSLLNRKEKTAERDVTHIQFTSWPDHGVPGEPSLLLKLRRRVNSFKNFFSGPIVIHCSAGVGRTGTYIGIDAMIESLEAEGRVDIYGYVVKLRRQRCLMVQVEAQYILIHTALIEYNQFGETEISLSDFHSAVNTLRQKEGSEPSLLEMEFQKIPKFKNWRTSNTASTEENKKKNRSSIVPYDFNRVLIKLEEDNSHGSDVEDEEDYSSDEDDETPTKYINASYLDGYWCERSVIAAQGPLSDTVEDFLQMLYQQRVKTVIMLTDCTENGQEFCCQYWSDEKKRFGEMEVEVKETETFPTYIRRNLEIQHVKRKESHTAQQYHFLKWVGNELPANPHDLIDMMKNIRQNGAYKNSRENRGAPIVVHCNDGSLRSGIACALWNILDSADTEKLVDIFQVTKNLRKERPGMITTLEQYQFLYAALEVAFPVQNGEVKKAVASIDTVEVINEETALISAAAEDQEGTAGSQPAEQLADPGDSGANGDAGASEDTGPSRDAEVSKDTGVSEVSGSSKQPEKPTGESATNGPNVTVEA